MEIASMPNYRRAFVPGGCWFFTVNLLDRGSSLLTDEIDVLRDATQWTRQRYPFQIGAFVVLPNHLHAVWTLPPDDADFSIRWRLIKSRFARSIPKCERLSAVRRARGERGIWQRRFWEHLIRDEADFARHVEYCLHQSGEACACSPRARLAAFVVSPRRARRGFSQGLGGGNGTAREFWGARIGAYPNAKSGTLRRRRITLR